MLWRSTSLFIVLAIVSLGFFANLTPRATGQSQPIGRSVLEWRITRVEPATKEAKQKDSTYLGSIFIVKSNADGETVDRKWLYLSTKTKLTIDGTAIDAGVAGLEKGMAVDFNADAPQALMEPPTAYPTEVRAWRLRAR
jgi:hypothetical protein